MDELPDNNQIKSRSFLFIGLGLALTVALAYFAGYCAGC